MKSLLAEGLRESRKSYEIDDYRILIGLCAKFDQPSDGVSIAREARLVYPPELAFLRLEIRCLLQSKKVSEAQAVFDQARQVGVEESALDSLGKQFFNGYIAVGRRRESLVHLERYLRGEFESLKSSPVHADVIRTVLTNAQVHFSQEDAHSHYQTFLNRIEEAMDARMATIMGQHSRARSKQDWEVLSSLHDLRAAVVELKGMTLHELMPIGFDTLVIGLSLTVARGAFQSIHRAGPFFELQGKPITGRTQLRCARWNRWLSHSAIRLHRSTRRLQKMLETQLKRLKWLEKSLSSLRFDYLI
jgi:hypothetical protein